MGYITYLDNVYFVIVILACVMTLTAVDSLEFVHAQQSIISVGTTDNNYKLGDTLVVFGNVTTIIGQTPVLLQIYWNEQSLIYVEQLDIAGDGRYTHIISLDGDRWKAGDYVIRVSYGEINNDETAFTMTPKQISSEPSLFVVDAGNHGTFDVPYTILGGTVLDMTLDWEKISLFVYINTTDDGTIIMDLPRQFIGAERSDGRDEIFIALIDNIDVPYTESIVPGDSRRVTIDFDHNDHEIRIIGTYVVPEFGSMAIVVMLVGIISVILLMGRNNMLQHMS